MHQKLSEWANENSYTYRGAYGLFRKGKIPGAKTLESGAIVVKIIEEEEKENYTVIYTRVSSSQNKSNLESQASRLIEFCRVHGWTVDEIIKECASGLNDKRPKLLKILKARRATRIVVEHKDRLTRFGFNFIKELLPDCEIIIVNKTDTDKEDLIQDFVSIVTSFCARIYGLRRSRRKTEKIIESLSQ